MTIGELSARTGFSAKAIRRYEARGLVYSAGRSHANYRLYDDSALMCLQVISTLRQLSLTIKEIEQLAGVYLGRPGEPIEPHVSDFLDRADRRLADRIENLTQARRRVHEFRKKVAAGEIGRLVAADQRRAQKGA
ncbi:MAG TPA: MerR family transcriptional regulator [Candidatus Dormibacteraeota bacterium]|nr:MerR family transcriptional regulator [Candidatus Dormibacteraeota bacterium]